VSNLGADPKEADVSLDEPESARLGCAKPVEAVAYAVRDEEWDLAAPHRLRGQQGRRDRRV
jgi:hypothetical protein